MSTYIVKIIAMRTSEFAESDCDRLVTTATVSLEEDTLENKEEAMKEVASKYIGSHSSDLSFEQNFEIVGDKIILTSEWDHGNKRNALYGLKVELIPSELDEL